jgi:hypothetical protein
MKRFKGLLAVMFVVAISVPSQTVVDSSPPSGVTGAGAGVFPPGANLLGIPLSGLTFGNGVFLSGDGSAQGQFQSTLFGTSVLGQPLKITVEGEASNASANVDGSIAISGAASVDLGDGSAPSTGVPFSVTVTTGSIQLVLDSITLPAATIVRGSITIE